MNMRLVSVCFIVFALSSVVQKAKAEDKYSQSLRFSCFNEPFLTVSVSTPRRDSFPKIDLEIVDPEGRGVGNAAQGRSIPRNQYGNLVEMPNHPEMSKAVGGEICGAKPGRYLVRVSEHDRLEYRLRVSGDDGTRSNEGNGTQTVMLHSETGRTCGFRFAFLIENGRVAIQWLDTTNHPLGLGELPVCEAIPNP